MKAISIKQPWASLIAAGIKTVEVRAWPTDHRGPLLICSSRRPVIPGHHHGQALCIVNLIDCRPLSHDDVPFTCVGRYLPRHFGWILSNAQLIHPIPIVGQLRLFDVRDKLIRLIDPILPFDSGEA